MQKSESAEEEKLIIPPGTRGFRVDAPVTTITGGAGRDLRRWSIREGDIIFIAAADGRYCHTAEDGRIVIDGKLLGYIMRGKRPKPH